MLFSQGWVVKFGLLNVKMFYVMSIFCVELKEYHEINCNWQNSRCPVMFLIYNGEIDL